VSSPSIKNGTSTDVPSKLDDFGRLFSLFIKVDKVDDAYVHPSLCFPYAALQHQQI